MGGLSSWGGSLPWGEGFNTMKGGSPPWGGGLMGGSHLSAMGGVSTMGVISVIVRVSPPREVSTMVGGSLP